MPDDDFEILVSEHCITEICRTPHVTTLQAHGEEWSAQPIVNIHGDSLGPARVHGTAPPATPSVSLPRLDRVDLFWVSFGLVLVLGVWIAMVVKW